MVRRSCSTRRTRSKWTSRPCRPAGVGRRSSFVDLAYEHLQSYISEAGYSGSQMAASDQAVKWNLSQGLYELAGLAGGWGGLPARELRPIQRRQAAPWTANAGRSAVRASRWPPTRPAPVGGVRSGTTAAANLLSSDRQTARCDPAAKWFE